MFTALLANASDNPVEADGTLVTLPSGTYATSAPNAPALKALNAGSILATGDLVLITTGHGAAAALATGASSQITLDSGGTVISTSGNDSVGLHAQAGAGLTVRRVQVSTTGAASHAAAANGTASNIIVVDSDMGTTGDAAVGARIEDGARMTLQDTNVQTTGVSSHGVQAYQGAGVINLRGGSILSSGHDARGILLSAGSHTVTLDVRGSGSAAPLLVRTEGAGAAGLEVDGAGHAVLLESVLVDTQGDDARGVLVLGSGHALTASHLEVVTHGARSEAVGNRGGDLVLSDAVLTTHGNASHALYAGQSTTSGAGPSINATRVAISTDGVAAHGAMTADGGQISMDAADIAVSGARSAGFAVVGSNTSGTIAGSSIRASGTDGMGLTVQAAGTVDADAVNVVATGEGASAFRAVMASQTVPDASNIATLRNTALHASHGTGISVVGGNLGMTLETVSVKGRDAAIMLSDDAGNPLREATINATASTFVGDVIDRGTGRSTLLLQRGSTLTGRVGGLDTLQLSGGSVWTLTASSDVGALSVEDSTVAFPTDAADHAVLTINGNYIGHNAILVMRTRLQDDLSPTDRLHVLGDTAGDTRLRITNAGGAGAQTVDGIKVVQVDGISDGRFTLDGRAVGGAHEYFLHQGSPRDAQDGNWYLRSQEDPVVIDPPPGPGTGGPGPGPILRPEAAVYLALQALPARSMQHRFHDRLGESALDPDGGDAGVPIGTWGRVQTGQDRITIADQLTTRTHLHHVQAGSHLLHWGSDNQGFIGVMGAITNARTTALAPRSGYSASGRQQGRTLGVYASWYGSGQQRPGWYADTWLQHGEFSNTVHGEGLEREQFRTKATTASVEIGRSFAIVQDSARSVMIEPQAQATFTHGAQTAHVEVNGTRVATRMAGGLQTRVGVRLSGHGIDDGNNLVQLFTTLNWYRNHRINSLAMDAQRLHGGLPRDRLALAFGAQLRMSARLTGWGQAEFATGDADYLGIGGQIGVKYSW